MLYYAKRTICGKRLYSWELSELCKRLDIPKSLLNTGRTSESGYRLYSIAAIKDISVAVVSYGDKKTVYEGLLYAAKTLGFSPEFLFDLCINEKSLETRHYSIAKSIANKELDRIAKAMKSKWVIEGKNEEYNVLYLHDLKLVLNEPSRNSNYAIYDGRVIPFDKVIFCTKANVHYFRLVEDGETITTIEIEKLSKKDWDNRVIEKIETIGILKKKKIKGRVMYEITLNNKEVVYVYPTTETLKKAIGIKAV